MKIKDIAGVEHDVNSAEITIIPQYVRDNGGEKQGPTSVVRLHDHSTFIAASDATALFDRIKKGE